MDYGTLTTLKDMFKDVMESEPTEAAKEDNDAE
jgi:hypothetical protein